MSNSLAFSWPEDTQAQLPLSPWCPRHLPALQGVPVPGRADQSLHRYPFPLRSPTPAPQAVVSLMRVTQRQADQGFKREGDAEGREQPGTDVSIVFQHEFSEAGVPMLLGALPPWSVAPVPSGAQLPRSWRGFFRSGHGSLLATLASSPLACPQRSQTFQGPLRKALR